MAALLVSLAVMSVLMAVALPVWRQQAQREKEAELVFRGEQYARAIALYRVKNGNNFPPSIDVLVQGRFLRKKYLDPITQKDFDIIAAGSTAGAPQGGPAGAARGNTPTGGGRSAFPPPPTSATQQFTSSGIMGVHSKSQETSIRIYKGQNRYDQWNFVFTAVNRPGGNVPGAEGPMGPGGRGEGMPGGRGGPGGRGTGGRGGRGIGGRGDDGGRGRGVTFPAIRGGGPGGNPIIRPQGPGE